MLAIPLPLGCGQMTGVKELSDRRTVMTIQTHQISGASDVGFLQERSR